MNHPDIQHESLKSMLDDRRNQALLRQELANRVPRGPNPIVSLVGALFRAFRPRAPERMPEHEPDRKPRVA